MLTGDIFGFRVRAGGFGRLIDRCQRVDVRSADKSARIAQRKRQVGRAAVLGVQICDFAVSVRLVEGVAGRRVSL